MLNDFSIRTKKGKKVPDFNAFRYIYHKRKSSSQYKKDWGILV